MKGLGLLLGCLSLMSLPLRGRTQDPAQADFDFAGKIAPILSKNCLLCHGGEQVRAGLKVTSRDALLKGGEHGPAIVSGDPENSLLIRSVRYHGKIHMPPKGKLDGATLDTLADWIKQGAPWPKDAKLPPAPEKASEEQPSPPGKILREPRP